MRLEKLSILNYKNIREAELELCSNINCFVGKNGMGKTNLLDAIYYLSFCKSHFNVIDSQNICHDADFMLIQGQYSRNEETENIYCGIKRKQKKQFKRNKKDYEKLSDHIGLLPLVLVSPNDSELIAEGSEERRRFMDGVISQHNKTYLQCLMAYNNALKQRNALLKMETPVEETLYAVLEEQMARNAEYIYAERKKFIATFEPIFQDNYAYISGGQEQVTLNYTSQLDNRDLTEAFVRTRERDKILGYTTQGIHKDDLEMQLGDYPIKRVGSQGQNKTYLIALKFAQFEFLRQIHGLKPLLLLDDIFDKLDSWRVKRIIELVASDKFGQIFITDTNREHLNEIIAQITATSKLFQVEQGVVSLL